MLKIKTFNVEEEVYKQLLAIFKKSGVDESLSSFVNNCLKELLMNIREVEQAKKRNPNYKVTMLFVISELAKSLANRKTVPPIITEVGFPIEHQELYDIDLLNKWEDACEANRLGVSVDMYSYVKGGNYVLGPNKQYLIDKKTGKKYVVIPTHSGSGILGEIRED